MTTFSDKELLARQKQLQIEGAELLNTSGIVEIISAYGVIETEGSYVYGLMTHPDIDLAIIQDDPTKESFERMVVELTACAGVHNIKTSDRVNGEHGVKKAIKGYWVGLLLAWRGTEWHLDIWYQKPEWRNDKTALWLEKFSALTPEKRVAILRMKEDLRAQGRYGVGKEFVGVDVYKTILGIV